MNFATFRKRETYRIAMCCFSVKIGLFGSYEWADGEWMRTWQQRVESAGGVMIADGVTAYGAPDSDALSACRVLGEKAAK